MIHEAYAFYISSDWAQFDVSADAPAVSSMMLGVMIWAFLGVVASLFEDR